MRHCAEESQWPIVQLTQPVLPISARRHDTRKFKNTHSRLLMIYLFIPTADTPQSQPVQVCKWMVIVLCLLLRYRLLSCTPNPTGPSVGSLLRSPCPACPSPGKPQAAAAVVLAPQPRWVLPKARPWSNAAHRQPTVPQALTNPLLRLISTEVQVNPPSKH